MTEGGIQDIRQQPGEFAMTAKMAELRDPEIEIMVLFH